MKWYLRHREGGRWGKAKGCEGSWDGEGEEDEHREVWTNGERYIDREGEKVMFALSLVFVW